MQSPAHASYLETEVLTAAPQRLQLMLIDAAIRAIQRAGQHWQAGSFDLGCETVIKAQQIVAEILGGMNREAAPDLVKRVASVYLFVFRSLVDANHHRDPERLDDALRVLHEEQETWRQLCEQLASRKNPGEQAAVYSPQQAFPASPRFPHLAAGEDYSAGFSVEV